MPNRIGYNGADKWKQKATELLNGGGGGGGYNARVEGETFIFENNGYRVRVEGETLIFE